MTNPLKSIFGFLSKLKPQTKQAKVVTIAILIFVAAAGVIFYINNSNSSKDVARKIDSLNKNEDVTCGEIIDQIGSASADKVSKYEDKRTLLQWQLECFSNNAQYDKAIAAAQKLRLLYVSKNDKENIERMEKSIQTLKDAKSHDEARQKESNAQAQ